jgi:hypothetical protein
MKTNLEKCFLPTIRGGRGELVIRPYWDEDGIAIRVVIAPIGRTGAIAIINQTG